MPRFISHFSSSPMLHPTQPVRAHSGISVLPPPSRLLLPRIRSTPTTPLSPRLNPSRSPPTPAEPTHTALEWLGLPLNFDVVQEQLEIEGYQMYAVEKWIVERNRPITVLTVYTGDPSHKITVTALAPSSSLSEREAVAQWEQALLHLRRDASARPKQTSNGVLMATSLAYFRSDYTIVHIPHGNFLLAKDQLYSNINLLRMGCSGRSALSLEEPSDSTKERFISTYHIPEITYPTSLPPLHFPTHLTSSENLSLPPSVSPSSSLTAKDVHLGSPTRKPLHYRRDSYSSPKSSASKGGTARQNLQSSEQINDNSIPPKTSALSLLAYHTKGRTKDLPFFNATVLELVKLVQVGLSLFGMYDVKENNQVINGLLVDGLLCDVTVQGIENWTTQIGEPRIGLEPVERIADPMFVSALLSLVVSTCNKLSALGFSNLVPKDPFLYPQSLSPAIASFINSIAPPATNLHSHPSPTAAVPYFSLAPMAVAVTTAPFAATALLNPVLPSSQTNAYYTPPNGSAAQVHLYPNTTPVHLTKDLVESIDAAYIKRVASMNDGDTTGTSPILTTATNASGSALVSTGNGSGSNTLSVPGSISATSGYTRRKVKSVLKNKLEDLTSAVTYTGDRDYDDGGDGGKDDRVGALSGGENDGNMSVGSSGGHLLRGVGNLLMSSANGMSNFGSGAGGIICVLEATVNLERFVAVVCEKEGRKGAGKSRRKKSGKGGDSVDFGRGNLSISGMGHYGRSNTYLPLAVINGDSCPIITLLWSGKVADVVALREWDKERERIEMFSGAANGNVSDGEEVKSEGIGGRSTEGEDSDFMLEGRGVNSFGGVWGGKMQRKIGNWTGLSKRKGQHSLDLTSSQPFSNKQLKGSHRLTMGPRVPNTKPGDLKTDHNKGRVQSPTLHPIISDLAEDELTLDSGQVSPTSDYYQRNPFTLERSVTPSDRGNLSFRYDTSAAASLSDLRRAGTSTPNQLKEGSIGAWRDVQALLPAFEHDYDKDVGSFETSNNALGKRPLYPHRGLSWSDSRSAPDPDKSGARKKRPRFESNRVLIGMEEEDEGVIESDAQRKKVFENDTTRRKILRRKSFHDLESLQSMPVLTHEQMSIDVELCGQILVMIRREEHLRNVVACLEVLTSGLMATNALLRDDFDMHRDAVVETELRSNIIEGIEDQRDKTDQITQATNTLGYESAQFLIQELWHTASLSRNKILELREKLFGTGGRRLPPGKYGAHGRFNRVQYTLDAKKRLVDYLGRTESEAEEDHRVGITGINVRPPPPEDEEEVVEHPAIKPMWLLRLFTSWGARWSAPKMGAAATMAGNTSEEKDPTVDNVK